MATSERYDAVVVGAGPNGLAAAVTLARAGLSVLVVEAEPTVGGGARSKMLTMPDFVHDVCSAVHPLAVSSPFFRTVPLEAHGVRWIHPPAPLAHPLDDGTAILLERAVADTAANLGDDARAYTRMVAPFADRFDDLTSMILGPARFPRHPLLLARFGLRGLRSATGLAAGAFDSVRARALFAGIAAHSALPLEALVSASFGLVLGAAAHAVGFPIPEGGSQKISDALASYFRELGGEIVCEQRVETIDELPKAKAYLFDVTPKQLVAIAGERLPAGYRARLDRYRYGPGAFKLDWALSGPIPWKSKDCARACTLHLGGTMGEIAASERALFEGRAEEKPYVLVAQPSLFDPSRAPPGKHVGWAYCHVPNGSRIDMTDRIEAQVERFAPGFRDLIVGRSVLFPSALERYNANYVGGDINGGLADLVQLFARPVMSLDPYATPARDIFLCSSSTPPGGGVHGMCGYWAARSALRRVFRHSSR